MNLKHTTVIPTNPEIEKLKQQIAQLTKERDEFQKESISANIKVEKMKCLMDEEQLKKVFPEQF